MWFTGRFSGAATVLVLDPSQVTVLPEEAGAFGAEVCAVCFEPPVVEPEPVEPVEPVEPEVPVEPWEAVAPVEPVEPESAPGVAVPVAVPVELVVAAPSSWAPVPSLHAVRESAARTAVAAAAARRVREVRRAVMSLCPFGVRVSVVTG
jgi:hypothetical protein